MTKYTEEELIKELQRVSEEHCNYGVPRIEDIKKNSNISLSTYNRIFGGIIKARKEANFQRVDLRKRGDPTFNYNFQYGILPSTMEEVLNRDDEFCQVCFENSNIEMHHITPVKYWKVEEEQEKMNHPRNLISLCRSCHSRLEGKFKGRNHEEFEKLAKDYLDIEETEEKKGIFDY